ncbi:MAG: response regulator [Lachnospiraceae bacterium]|nr:response regulator [Lachnospiraceae bacterium]MBQ2406456.1 response regulator [Lachnospiraceae bacterium]MBQ5850363.1 response regulator [Lachnospiraceae bacterium]
MMEAQAGKVEDTGIGIKEENFSKVFGKFEQFDKKENYNIEGTGLGLAIVKSFVEMMGGDISFVSEYGKGTKFMVNLWQEIGEKEKTESAVYEENSANGVPEINPGRILVVDDNKLNCDVTQGILELLGMDTQITYSGADCIKKLEDGENYDLIFMDHMMPEMDGVETLDRIRNMGEEFKTLPVVLLTANAVSGIKEQMIDRGFDDYLSKPIDVDELQHVLVRFLGCKG